MSKQFLTRNFQQRVEIQKAKSKAGKKATVQGKANQAIATGMANAVTVSFTKGMTTFKKRVDSEALSKHIFDGEFEKAVETVPWDKMSEDLNGIRPPIEQAYVASAAQAVRRLPAPARKLRLDTKNPTLSKFIDTQIGRRITDITTESRKSVQVAVREAFDKALTPKQTAKMVRASVGITEKQNLRILRTREREIAERIRLQGKMKSLKARGLDKSKTAANTRIKLTTLTDDKIQNRVLKRIDATQKNRSVTIARTELTEAVSNGQLAAWDEAADRGLIDRTKARKVWVNNFPDRTEICRDLDGTSVPVDGEFYVKQTGRSVPAPPAHINCRGAIILKFD